jgi:biopolymer transport protein ExbD
MGADVGGGDRRSGKKGKKKSAKRVPIRLDMTPMVDVAFLLLIFYMVTTVFKTPQALELTLPPNQEATTQIAQSKVLTLRVLPGGAGEPRIFWHRGDSVPVEIRMERLPAVLNTEKSRMEGDDLITLIKIDREASYEAMVRITDELGLAEIDKFSLVPLTDQDRKELSAL